MMGLLRRILPVIGALSLVCACGKNDPEPYVPVQGNPQTPSTPPKENTGPIYKYGLRELAQANKLMIGSEFTYGEYADDSLKVVLKRDFEAVTFGNEMKNDQIVTPNGEFNFIRADQMVTWAKDCGLKLFGHTLGWHSQQQNDYLVDKLIKAAANQEEAAAKVREFHKKWVDAMVAHFDVYAWDVVNEVLTDAGEWRNTSNTDAGYHVFLWGSYYSGGTKEFVDAAFRSAREALEREKKTADLYINDYNLEGGWAHGKLEALCKYAESNPDVSGVGTQMHVSSNLYDKKEVKNMLERMVKTGKKVRISELDVVVVNGANQADIIVDIFDQYLTIVPENQRGGITFWGVSDKNSWRKAENKPLIYSSKYQRKESYQKLYDYLLDRSGLDK